MDENATMFLEDGMEERAEQVQLIRSEALILVLDTPKGMDIRVSTDECWK
jgi:hypothetical protein